MPAYRRPGSKQKDEFLAMILAQTGEDTGSTFEPLELTKEQFAKLCRRTGEVSMIRWRDEPVGYLWTEHRDGTPHNIHGPILFSEARG
jgi:hypothetical protein